MPESKVPGTAQPEATVFPGSNDSRASTLTPNAAVPFWALTLCDCVVYAFASRPSPFSVTLGSYAPGPGVTLPSFRSVSAFIRSRSSAMR